jgi:hypothetical protein
MRGRVVSYALYAHTAWGLDMRMLSLCLSLSVNIPEVEAVKEK